MANGNFGGGDGTEANPYLIEDWDDFFAQDSTSYYKLSNDLDGNNYNGGVMNRSKSIMYLDGDSHALKNIYVAGNNYFISLTNGCVIQNVKFINCYTEGVNVDSNHDSGGFFNLGYARSKTATLKNCYIEVASNLAYSSSSDMGYPIFFSNNGTSSSNSSSIQLYECSISCGCPQVIRNWYNNSDYLASINKFYRCDIFCNGIPNGTINDKQLIDPFRSAEFRRCRIRGNVMYSKSPSVTFYNCVIAVSVKYVSSSVTSSIIIKVGSDSAYQGITIMDSTLWGSTPYTFSTDSYAKALTTEQMQNLEYLQSIGFNISQG